MKKYFINKNRQESYDGNHNEVHEEGCYWLEKARDVEDLGYHYSCKGAMIVVLEHYPNTADGCKKCCYECHTG